MLLKWAYGRQRCMECVRIHISFGILRPLANPETLKNLPMCNFEKPAYGNGPFFKLILKKYPKFPPKYPTARAPWGPGVGIWCICPNYFEKCPLS